MLVLGSFPVNAQNAGEVSIPKSQVDAWMDELSNWGRWGAEDQLGTLNLITPAKRRAAAALVTSGVAISLAREVDVDTVGPGATAIGYSVRRGRDRRDRYLYHRLPWIRAHAYRRADAHLRGWADVQRLLGGGGHGGGNGRVGSGDHGAGNRDPRRSRRCSSTAGRALPGAGCGDLR